MVWRYLLVLIVLVGIPSVRASEEWEDFANNFATDLAPLVALFGERLTKQFLAESTSSLDNFIFALCPLGILTAVVSLIRICGSSSLRAFVGRANEPPGEAENELLSCVSEGTAELFNDGGISRVIGRPRILEVAVWEENGVYKLNTLRGALKSYVWNTNDMELQSEKGMSGMPELDIPNLSLNKGIKRRGIGWFWAAAAIGVLLQGGTVAYATMTVFTPVLIFGNDNDTADDYALPLYFFGSTSLSLGMFLCAFLIERSSRESYIYSATPSKLYWLQPGRQTIGDQDFGAFLAVDEGPEIRYIKSVRGPQIRGKRPLLIFTIFATMLGFVAQFVGLRGLHPSVIIAGAGSTLIMAVVRTLLRTKRIGSDANRFQQEDRETFSHNQQELDCFAFHLEKVKSFQLMSSPVHQSVRSRSGSCSTGNSTPSTGSNRLGSRLIQTRARLAELTSCGRHPSMNWDDLPIRKVAHDLAKTIETTMEVVSRWKELPGSICSFELTFACHPTDDKSCGSLETYPVLLKRSDDTFQWKVDANELEAILGLWTFSLLKSESNWLQRGLGRAVGLTKSEAGSESADLYFHKWIFRQREAMMVSSEMISFPNQTFGYYSDDHSDRKEILVVKTENSLQLMAAQDIYIQFLMNILKDLDTLGDEVNILSVSHKSFLAQSAGLDELVSCFEAGNLGSREDALLCIVPVLKHRDLLPELAGDMGVVRDRVQRLTVDGNWDSAFALLQWLCERSESAEFERSVYDLGFLCARAMLHEDSNVRKKGFQVTLSLLQTHIRASFFRRSRLSRTPCWLVSRDQEEWWKRFSSQLGWFTWAIINTKGDQHNIKTKLETMPAARNLTPQADDVTDAQQIFLEWVIPEIELGPRSESFDLADDTHMELCLSWMSRNRYDSLCHWFSVCWVNISHHYYQQSETEHAIAKQAIVKAFQYAASSESNFAIRTLCRRGADINTVGPENCTALGRVVELQNVAASSILLANGADVNACAIGSGIPPLFLSAWQGNEELLLLLLQHKADLEARDAAGFTPLHMACQGVQLNTAALLLNMGANIETVANDGYTPLLSATMDRQLNIMRLLLDRGANVEATDRDGDTPLMLAVRRHDEDVVRLLLRYKADVGRKDRFERTALDHAKEKGLSNITAVLEAADRVVT
ncbi:ankyrin repeat domain-containing protein [Aspergillus stella-maris]|uniref:ankyrin repeat domain-containing protein n=1 Tax=Aspergillus stella-maris TaxID=1810926 RepID=UPI003CCCA13E